VSNTLKRIKVKINLFFITFESSFFVFHFSRIMVLFFLQNDLACTRFINHTGDSRYHCSVHIRECVYTTRMKCNICLYSFITHCRQWNASVLLRIWNV